ncbi:MAG: hypothetical protein APF84_11940 [Gracilibacter sp. BRH_c7a]|nr:MAG: hypothetical protein APF84_11940 [Gracilibacter sp. BRH_c7a]
MNKKYFIRFFVVVLFITVILLTRTSFPAAAVYSIIYNVNFHNSSIQITAPTINNASVDKFLTVAGKTSHEIIFICLKGPAGEISVYPVEVINDKFEKNIWLRFGSGTYTIWAGDNNQQFDGSIRFIVQNISQADYRYTTPSGYVNSDDTEIIKIANSLVTDKMTNLQKTKVIYDFVAQTIKYDYDVSMYGENQLNTATSVLHSQLGICRDFAFTFAAIARAAGIPTRVVYGETLNTITNEIDLHAWNQSYINRSWINIDTSWNAGFNTPDQIFAKTHSVTSITIF